MQIGIGITYGLKNTDYINVIGDFIFTISVSKKFAHNIDAFFRANNTVTTENINELKKLCNRSDKVKMVFTRSKKEAAKWHTKWNKDFYIPRQ